MLLRIGFHLTPEDGGRKRDITYRPLDRPRMNSDDSDAETVGELECRRDRDPTVLVMVDTDDDRLPGRGNRVAMPSHDRTDRLAENGCARRQVIATKNDQAGSMARLNQRLFGGTLYSCGGDVQTLEVHTDSLVGGLKNGVRGFTLRGVGRGVHDLQRRREFLGDHRCPACCPDRGEAPVDSDDDGIRVSVVGHRAAVHVLTLRRVSRLLQGPKTTLLGPLALA